MDFKEENEVKQDVKETNPAKNNDSQPKKRRILKILIPALIIVAVVVLYFFKNSIGTPAETTIDPAKGEYASAEFNLDATEDFDLEKTLSHGLPVIIDFGADSCEPCKLMAPLLVELNQELRGKAVIKFVDVWKNAKAAGDLPLQAIPTQFFFNADGTPYVPSDIDTAAKNGFIMYEIRDTGEHVYTVHQGYIGKDEMLEVLKEMGME